MELCEALSWRSTKKIVTQPLGEPLESLWRAFGEPLESLWGAPGDNLESPVESIWRPAGEPLASLWKASGEPPESLWRASGDLCVCCALVRVWGGWIVGCGRGLCVCVFADKSQAKEAIQTTLWGNNREHV